VSESTLERMLAVFDVAPLGPDRFAGESDAGGHGGRQVVEGSQILAQSMVAAGKALPGRVVRSAHALFVSVADPGEPLELGVAAVRAGRSFASGVVAVGQGGRTRATATVLLDRPQPDVIRHDLWSGPPPAGPEAAYPAELPMPGRELRIEGVHDPVAWDGWIRYHRESTFAGAGMAYVRGQVLTADGRLLASFTQDAMIRALDSPAASVPTSSRL
jgi:acyl-CoA thioesterase II